MAAVSYPLATIMSKAWKWARFGAARHGGKPVHYLAAALRTAWAEVKAELRATRPVPASDRYSLRAVLAECPVAYRRAMPSYSGVRLSGARF